MLALQAFGYSLNLISLLAMVLAIGLVVDDAIVVLENIVRRIEEGEAPLLAASRGAQQVGFAVIATTAVLLAVFSPVLFLQDATARLFVELAVTVSSLMALTLVPMLCSKVLRTGARQSLLSRAVNGGLGRMRGAYERSLRRFIRRPGWSLLLSLAALLSLGPLYLLVQREYVPAEDQDTVLTFITAAEGTNIDTMRGIVNTLQPPLLALQREGSLTRVLFISPFFGSAGPTRAFGRISMVPWDQRDYSAFELRDMIMRNGRTIPGVSVIAVVPGGLGNRGADTPVQFVLQGPDYEQLAEWRDIVIRAAQDSGLFGMLTSDLKEIQQQVHVEVDATRAASLGVSTREVAEALQALLTDQEVTTFTRDGEEYPVIVQLEAAQRDSPGDIESVEVRGSGGQLIRLSNLLSTESRAGIASLERYNRLRSVTISGSPAQGATLGQALEFLESTVSEQLPAIAAFDYRGESLDYKESSNDIVFAFALALLVLYLVMAAQFESFIHPAVIMTTVPLALVGGLLGLMITGQTLNLFSQIGLLMLIGIAAKNGILLVEFINQVRDEGVEFDAAIVSASVIRLRPVLMTTIATLMGAVPLVVMTGPGSVSRNVLGIGSAWPRCSPSTWYPACMACSRAEPSRRGPLPARCGSWRRRPARDAALRASENCCDYEVTDVSNSLHTSVHAGKHPGRRGPVAPARHARCGRGLHHPGTRGRCGAGRVPRQDRSARGPGNRAGRAGLRRPGSRCGLRRVPGRRGGLSRSRGRHCPGAPGNLRGAGPGAPAGG